MNHMEAVRAAVRAHDDRRNFFASAALGRFEAVVAVRSLLSAESLARGKPAPSDVGALVESMSAHDRRALGEIVRSWPAPGGVEDHPWFAAGWTAALRHLDPGDARAIAATSRWLTDEAELIFGANDASPVSFVTVAHSGALAIDWTTRRLAHRPLTESAIGAAELDGASLGWLRILRGRFDRLDDSVIDVFRRRLDDPDPDPYDIALVIEAARAKSFRLDDRIADRLMVWTDEGTRSWNAFQAVLTLLTDWIVP